MLVGTFGHHSQLCDPETPQFIFRRSLQVNPVRPPSRGSNGSASLTRETLG